MRTSALYLMKHFSICVAECAYDPESDEEGGIPCNQTPTAHVSGTTSVSSQWRDLDKDEWPTSSKCSAKFPNHVTVSASVSATASSNESDYMSMTEGYRVRRHPKQRPSQNFRHRPEHRLDTVTVDKMGCLMESYENLLEGQLADQQIFFEKKLAKETILALEESLRRGRYSNSNQLVAASCNAINEVTVAPNNSSGSSSDRKCIDGSVSSPKEPGSGRDSSVDFEAVDAQLAGVEISKIEISALEHEYSLILSKLKEVEAQGRAVRRLNETLIREQKVLRDRVEVLNRSEEETKRQCEEQVSELEQQIRDLCFYTKMKNQVASSPLKEELAGGSMVVPMGIPTVAGTKKKVPLSSHKKPR